MKELITNTHQIKEVDRVNEESENKQQKRPSMRDVIIYLDDIYKGDWNKTYSHISRKEKVDVAEVNKRANKIKSSKDIITIIDDNYPEELKKVIKPPFVVFKNKKGKQI